MLEVCRGKGKKKWKIPLGALGRFMPPLAGWLAGWQVYAPYIPSIRHPPRPRSYPLTKGSCRILYDMHRKLIDDYYVPLRRARRDLRLFSRPLFFSPSCFFSLVVDLSGRVRAHGCDFSAGKIPWFSFIVRFARANDRIGSAIFFSPRSFAIFLEFVFFLLILLECFLRIRGLSMAFCGVFSGGDFFFFASSRFM